MSREISCISCNLYLGEIIEARLHKEIRFLCPDCNIKRIASDMNKKPYSPISDDATMDFLKGTFGFK